MFTTLSYRGMPGMQHARRRDDTSPPLSGLPPPVAMDRA